MPRRFARLIVLLTALTLAAAPVSPALTADESAAPAGAVFTPKIPDVPVSDQTGRQLHFYSDLIKGRTVAINFMFTTCTTICPQLTMAMRRIQQQLGDRIGRDVWLVSISVDPTTDVPERLQRFAAKFDVGPAWTFVTGRKADIEQLLTALGSAGLGSDHATTILIGNDRAGCWTRSSGLAPTPTNLKLIIDATGATVNCAKP